MEREHTIGLPLDVCRSNHEQLVKTIVLLEPGQSVIYVDADGDHYLDATSGHSEQVGIVMKGFCTVYGEDRPVNCV